jgi:E3 ubiquitin-protein ligase NEDD4
MAPKYKRCFLLLPRHALEMLTLDLKKSTGNETVHGKLIVNLSTNVNAPARNGNNTIMPSNPQLTPSQPTSSSLSREESSRLSVPSQSNAHTMSSAQTASRTSADEEPLPAGCVHI